jgi:hypothetical protein
MLSSSTWTKLSAAIPLLVLALTTPPRAQAAPEITVQNGVISACDGSECIRYVAMARNDGLVSFMKLEANDNRAPAPTPSPIDPVKRALEQLLKELLRLPNTCVFCDLTKKRIWDEVMQEWLRNLGIKEVPGSSSLLCPNKEKMKALIKALAERLKARDSLKELLELVKRLKALEPLRESTGENVQALKRALDALEQRLRELQSLGADDATIRGLIDQFQDLLWKLIFGDTSEPAKSLVASIESIDPDGSGIARTPEECLMLAGAEADGTPGQAQE